MICTCRIPLPLRYLLVIVKTHICVFLLKKHVELTYTNINDKVIIAVFPNIPTYLYMYDVYPSARNARFLRCSHTIAYYRAFAKRVSVYANLLCV